MSTEDLLWLAALCIAAAAGFWYWYGSTKRARLLEDTPTSKCRSAAQGYVELKGTQHSIPGVENVAPLSRTPCPWWKFSVEKRETKFHDGKYETYWVGVDSGESNAMFLIRDETGEAFVDPRGAEIISSVSSVWYGTSIRPTVPSDAFGLLDNYYRYTEQRTDDGDRIYAAGYLRTLTDSPSNLAQAPKLKPGDNLLTCPPDDRPFILSNTLEEPLTRETRLTGIIGLVVFFVCGGIVVLATTMRLLH